MIIDLTPICEKTGPARLLDMVEGRSKAVFKQWLAGRPKAWSAGIEVVAMDGFTGFKTAAAEELPDAVPVMDPFHVIRLAGDGLDRCRQRVQQDTTGHRGRAGDPLYKARRTLHTGAGLLTEKQRTRLEAVFAVEEHVEVEATWGIYQRTVAAYREPDKAKGKQLMQAVIDAVTSGVPTALVEIRRLGRTLKQRAADVLAFFDRPVPATARPKRSTGASSTSAAPPWASGTSPTTSPGACLKPVDSDPTYTLKCDEPSNAFGYAFRASKLRQETTSYWRNSRRLCSTRIAASAVIAEVPLIRASPSLKPSAIGSSPARRSVSAPGTDSSRECPADRGPPRGPANSYGRS